MAATAKAPQQPETTPVPTFKAYEELKNKYNANIAHTFLFHGLTFDYMKEHMMLKTYLINKFRNFGKNPKSIIFFDKAEKLHFPTETDEKKFTSVLAEELKDYEGRIPTDSDTCLTLIGKALQRDHFALIMEYSETIFPNGDMAHLSDSDRHALVSLLRWARDTKDIKRLGNFIILITSSLSRVNPMIRETAARIESIGIPYPDPDERTEFIVETIREREKEGRKVKFEEGFSVEAMARGTAGLAKVHIMDIIQRSFFDKVPVSYSMVKERKEDIIKAEFQQVLQIIEPEFGFEGVGGYEYVKRFFRKNVIDAVKSGNYLRVPMGVLLMGPAGTGKTRIAEAVAKECGINFAVWNIGRMKERWVGASEENTDKGIWAIKSIRPVIVFIDEIDTAASRGNHGDSGVSNYQMKALLEFMSDTSHRGEIIFLSATNRPQDIDFALRRTGRFDKKIPVLPPSTKELPNVYITMLNNNRIKHSLTEKDIEANMQHLSGKASHWDTKTTALVGSDAQEIVRKAYEIADDEGHEEVTIEELKQAAGLIRPSLQDLDSMITAAINECNDLSLLPEDYKDRIPAASVKMAEDGVRNLD